MLTYPLCEVNFMKKFEFHIGQEKQESIQVHITGAIMENFVAPSIDFIKPNIKTLSLNLAEIEYVNSVNSVSQYFNNLLTHQLDISSLLPKVQFNF